MQRKTKRKIMQPLSLKKKIMYLHQNCIGATIHIGREIQCLPYAGFYFYRKWGGMKSFQKMEYPSWNYFQGAVYIQIIRSSKSLCAITEAHDVPRNFRMLWKMSGILISLTGNQTNVYAFFVSVFSSTISYWTFVHKCDIYNFIYVFIHV